MRALILAILLLSAGAPAQPAAAQMPAELQRLLDEAEVRRVADALDHAVDSKDWALARLLLADRLWVDMSSLGATPAMMAADDLIAGWRRAFQGGKTSLHFRTNHMVSFNGVEAVLISHGYAWNRLPGGVLPGSPEPALWEVWGTYEHRMERTSRGWRIAAFTFNALHERGDRRVPATVLPE